MGDVHDEPTCKRRAPLMALREIAMLKKLFIMVMAGTLGMELSTTVLASPLSEVVVPQMSDGVASPSTSPL
jgi:hypothetical protein